MESAERKEIARKRWKILAQVLQRGTCADVSDNVVSVRRFQTFGLLNTSPIGSDVSASNDQAGGLWFSYTCNRLPDLHMKIKHLDSEISAERLNGFNNTGNVCVWPSEEVMAYYCMQHVQDFKDQRVCELGGGMTCLAGIALGLYSDASHVEITDGNEESVQNLQCIIDVNDFGHTTMAARVVRWGDQKTDADLCTTFDTVICADCLFFDSGRESLASLIHDLLKPGGKALIFAPSRGKTFYTFGEIARSLFDVTEEENYLTEVWALHTKVII
ncbi:calmodulin-lysine N-methyltransferase [Plakobranchus ocellatus]|uniref:Calmodulin-lysine N-methyltransferase n=1 Tax=Plakobranchus ocellatus TaxID=259542 RepID=A0AAV4B300_9GAST|nr:calmodulin-lysine N-methyltransferase [Plakobranchus ocellatus]